MFQETKNINSSNISAGFFGKLPGFTDFIKYNAAGKEILAIDNWIQEGLTLAKLKYKDEWKNHYDRISCLNFIYPFTGTDSTTIGVLTPSTDKSGRSFPFIIFGNIKKNVNDDLMYYLIPSVFKEVYYSFSDIVDLNKSVEDSSRLKSLTDNIKVPEVNFAIVNENYKNFILKTSIGDIFNLENESQFIVNDIFENRLKISDHFVYFIFSSSLNEQTDLFMLSYYIKLLHKLFKSSDSIAGVFWTMREDNTLQLFLYFTKPTSKDFVDLLFYESALLNSIDESTYDNKKDFRSMNSIFRDNSIVNSSISLNEFMDSIKKYIY